MYMNIYVFDLIILHLSKFYQLLCFEIVPLEKRKTTERFHCSDRE